MSGAAVWGCVEADRLDVCRACTLWARTGTVHGSGRQAAAQARFRRAELDAAAVEYGPFVRVAYREADGTDGRDSAPVGAACELCGSTATGRLVVLWSAPTISGDPAI